MPDSHTTPEGLNTLTAQILTDNPPLRKRIERLIDTMLDDVERTFLIGDVKERAVYTRQLVPVLLRAMQDTRSEEHAAMKAAFERVMAAVRGDALGDSGE